MLGIEMEEEMLAKINEMLSAGARNFEEKNYQMAFLNYLNALLSIGSYLIYRDLGLLYPPEGALGMMRVRYPNIYEIVLKYQGYQLSIVSVGENVAREIKEDTLRIYEREIKG